jgi:hypothetical protein
MSKYDDFGQNFPRNSFGALTTVAAVVVAFWGGGALATGKISPQKKKNTELAIS